MVNAFTNLLTSPTLSNIAQSTTSSVSIETGLKAVGRPSFILADKDINYKTKKYAATKEFLYQAICLATYMLIVIPIFKNGSFKLAQKHIFKDEKMFEKFKNANEFLNYRKLAAKPREERVNLLGDVKYKNMFSKENLVDLKLKDSPEPYNLIKGVVEFGNTIGSVLGLAIFAPEVSHLVVHPVMKLIGMEKRGVDQEKHELDIEIEDNELKIDLENTEDLGEN